MSEMMQQVRQAKEEARHAARTGEGGNPNGQAEELPQGSSPVEAREETPVIAAEATEEASEGGTEGEAPAESAPAEPKKLIRIGEREFTSEADAIKYAEELEREKLSAELYNQGVRDALAAQSRPAEPQAEPEDNFEERFYANPKETLKEIQSKARDEALAAIRAENQKESLWNQFLAEYPDIRRKDAERIMSENAQTFNAISDVAKGMKLLAQMTRKEYDEIRDLAKPRTELSNKSAQVLSPSGGGPTRVTPNKKDERPLTLAEQMRTLRRHS